MKSTLNLGPDLYNDLMQHLLRPDCFQEQAAFLFVSSHQSADQVQFDVLGSYKAGPADFAEQAGDYLELGDEVRAMVIKNAHDLEASMIELHSHPGPWPAQFSIADRMGLRETVPHMWWRLKGRPYLAIVTANKSFDALLWLKNPNIPSPLSEIRIGGDAIFPTNLSLEGWE